MYIQAGWWQYGNLWGDETLDVKTYLEKIWRQSNAYVVNATAEVILNVGNKKMP